MAHLSPHALYPSDRHVYSQEELLAAHPTAPNFFALKVRACLCVYLCVCLVVCLCLRGLLCPKFVCVS